MYPVSTIDRIKLAIAQGRLFNAIYSKVIKPYLYGIKYLFWDTASDSIELHCPEYINPSNDPEELKLVKRIFISFQKMKRDQEKVSNLYKPSSLWQKHIDKDYALFGESIAKNDFEGFHFFLTNFGTWKSYHGIENVDIIRNNMGSILRRKYLKNTTFFNMLNMWKWHSKGERSVDSLNYPQHGNQCGAFLKDSKKSDKVFIGVGSFSNDIYGTTLEGLLDEPHPIVADLGAGYGKFDYFVLRNIPKFTFIDFDLPEVLCVAAYYLMKTWPEKNALLYGEEEFDPSNLTAFDLIFMPSSEIEKLPKNSIDLFINKHSLGEMRKETAENFITHISNSSKLFFHLNHEIYPNVFDDGQESLLGHQYPVPKDEFQEIIRYPSLTGMHYMGGFDKRQDGFFYLYQKKIK